MKKRRGKNVSDEGKLDRTQNCNVEEGLLEMEEKKETADLGESKLFWRN